jgi:acyl carrier protein
MNLREALDWVSELFEENPEKITPDTPREDILAWDSLGALTLIAGMDETFGILLEDDEIQAMKSVNDILNILEKNAKLE